MENLTSVINEKLEKVSIEKLKMYQEDMSKFAKQKLEEIKRTMWGYSFSELFHHYFIDENNEYKFDYFLELEQETHSWIFQEVREIITRLYIQKNTFLMNWLNGKSEIDIEDTMEKFYTSKEIGDYINGELPQQLMDSFKSFLPKYAKEVYK